MEKKIYTKEDLYGFYEWVYCDIASLEAECMTGKEVQKKCIEVLKTFFDFDWRQAKKARLQKSLKGKIKSIYPDIPDSWLEPIDVWAMMNKSYLCQTDEEAVVNAVERYKTVVAKAASNT